MDTGGFGAKFLRRFAVALVVALVLASAPGRVVSGLNRFRSPAQGKGLYRLYF